MTSKSLSRAFAKAAELPPADQERLGRELDAYIKDLHDLRAMLDEGEQALDKELGTELDIDQVIAQARIREV